MNVNPQPVFLPQPGAKTKVAFRKFDGSPHWVNEAVFLGSDAQGDWVGTPTGCFISRPGASFYAESPSVQCFPRDRFFVATFNHPHPKVAMRIYVDLSSIPQWSPWDVNMIDLDLDVCVPFRGYLFLDDQHEYEEHSRTYGYPQNLMDAVEAEALDLQQDLSRETSELSLSGTWHLQRYVAGLPFEPWVRGASAK